jgi:4-amino-4-deoxychorismate lyase
MMRINGVDASCLPADDRGLAYGDGVFRTLECCNGVPRLWCWQLARLASDAAALGLALPDEAVLLSELALACDGIERAVAKIVLTRGQGPRGYAIREGCRQTLLVSAESWDGYPPAWAVDGIALAWCTLRLGLQPRLAGIKHLNRLENVLARSDLQGSGCQEGLLLDAEGRVIEGTMSNLFLRRGDEWLTPRLDRCGVAGALRAWVLAQTGAREVFVEPRAVLDADELFVCNSLAGIWPVQCLGTRRWCDFSGARALQALLAQAEA